MFSVTKTQRPDELYWRWVQFIGFCGTLLSIHLVSLNVGTSR
jgi:hypothetical protein